MLKAIALLIVVAASQQPTPACNKAYKELGTMLQQDPEFVNLVYCKEIEKRALAAIRVCDPNNQTDARLLHYAETFRDKARETLKPTPE